MTSEQKVKAAIIPALYKYLYLISGFLLVGIGVLGIFLPILPTTIFLILASACFMKSSPKANEWLRNNRFLGAYLRNYQDKTGLTVTAKVLNIGLLWISISLSAYFLTDELYIRLMLLAIAIGVTIHLLMIKTKIEVKK
ncbi:MAG TPA: YbaN family protein [Ignavibacteriaceae bacterium]|nr:YbaN family protein [Ignavibacteriaceae bacterium]